MDDYAASIHRMKDTVTASLYSG